MGAKRVGATVTGVTKTRSFHDRNTLSKPHSVVGEKVQTSIYTGLKGVQWEKPILQSSEDLSHSANKYEMR